MYLCMNECMYVCMHVCVYVCMYACMYVCMYSYYVCMYVCMYVCNVLCMYVCTYVCIDLYLLITYVFNHLLPLLLLSSLYLFYFCVFWGCSSSLDGTGIRVLPRNFRSSSPFSITRTNCSSAKFISATNLVCKGVDIFLKPFASLIQILRQSVALCNELIALVPYL